MSQSNLSFAPFATQINNFLPKTKITILQINLGKKCNLACNHCHVEASPKRTEELSAEVCDQLIELIAKFPQIETIDLTGGATEIHYGFKPLVEVAKKTGKEVIVRSNLTIYFTPGFEDIPEYCAKNQVRIIASLPCYLPENVDKMRGKGVFNDSIRAIQWLNKLGYGRSRDLILDLVYNPPIPSDVKKFSLPPNQVGLEQDYKRYLKEHFDLDFNHLFTLTNLPIGRTKMYLKHNNLYEDYLDFLANNYNESTLNHLMCKNQLSIDYLGNVYDCDFNQMENILAESNQGERLTVKRILEIGSLDVIEKVQIANYCYGCTAGSGSSCGGSLIGNSE